MHTHSQVLLGTLLWIFPPWVYLNANIIICNLSQSQCSEVRLDPSGYSKAAQAYASAKGQVCIWAFVPPVPSSASTSCFQDTGLWCGNSSCVSASVWLTPVKQICSFFRLTFHPFFHEPVSLFLTKKIILQRTRSKWSQSNQALKSVNRLVKYKQFQKCNI